jgi:hypothetical protein
LFLNTVGCWFDLIFDRCDIDDYSTSESTQTTSTNPSEQPNIPTNNSELPQGDGDINDTPLE